MVIWWNENIHQHVKGKAPLKGLLKLVSIWPDNYKAIAVKKPSEHAIMEMGGWMTYVMNFEGNPIYIYVQVGLPDMEMIPGPLRRVPGSLSIAVNPKTKAMAAIFIGQENLSEYRFTGDEKLLSILLAYLVADEAEQEKAYLISPSQIREDVIFPIPAERLSKVETRLSYLNGLYINGMITGARSAYDAGSDARKVPPEKQWWAANSSFTECFETGGPAAKLDQFAGYPDKPYTRDFHDSNGKLIKVEVINSDGGGQETVWTYYKEKAQCEAEEINATKSLADKYR